MERMTNEEIERWLWMSGTCTVATCIRPDDACLQKADDDGGRGAGNYRYDCHRFTRGRSGCIEFSQEAVAELADALLAEREYANHRDARITTLEAERDELREALESIATRTGGFADGWAQGLHRTATDALRATYHTKGEER